MSRVVVYHSSYGCDTGCCGHVVEVDGEWSEFTFSHPDHDTSESFLEFAKELVTQECGADHVADLDWNESHVAYW